MRYHISSVRSALRDDLSDELRVKLYLVTWIFRNSMRRDFGWYRIRKR